jgi:hypothetical protein
MSDEFINSASIPLSFWRRRLEFFRTSSGNKSFPLFNAMHNALKSSSIADMIAKHVFRVATGPLNFYLPFIHATR